MARPEKQIDSNISFGEYEEPEKVNPFADNVKAFVEHAKKHPNATLNVEVDVNDAQSTKFKIQRAANDLGHTAKHRFTDESKVKVIGKDEDGDIREGKVTIVFTLADKHKARNRKKSATTEATAE